MSSNNITQQHFYEMLKGRRRQMTSRQRQRKLNAPRRLYPWSTERKYAKQISAWLRPLRQMVNAFLKENAASLIRGDGTIYKIERVKIAETEYENRVYSHIRRVDAGGNNWIEADQVKWNLDAIPGRGYKTFLDSLNGWMSMFFPDVGIGVPPSALLLGLGKFADSIKTFDKREWDKTTKSILGTEFASSELWWPELKKAWTRNNYELIKTVAQKYVSNVNMEVEKAILNGWSSSSLVGTIKDLGLGLEDWQARRLARDQVGKINGSITQAQNEEMGIDAYEWQTAGDERVRGNPTGKYPNAIPSHYVMDKLLCRWDDATVCSFDGGKTWVNRPADAPQEHPGMPIQCRCTAVAKMNLIIEKIDRELAEEQAA